MGSRGLNGGTTYYITPSRKNVAAQVRALAEAVAAGRQLQAALQRLDASDKPRAAGLSRLLTHWLEYPAPIKKEPEPASGA